ncbi:MAG: hypothetical protein H7Y07_01140 [Pyrinomonadaceae bacterium]|nr:hypothetical protein [Sphingobacteriaceae bacterium]
MKKILHVLFLILFITTSYGQVVMTFKNAKAKGKSFEQLDSLYKNAVHSDINMAVFKTQDEQAKFQKAYAKLIYELAVFLKSKDFRWEKQTRCFNRIYFNSEGGIDYFLYNFQLGQLAPEKEKEFDRLLKLFVKGYKLSLNAKERFAQCSPIKYTDI